MPETPYLQFTPGHKANHPLLPTDQWLVFNGTKLLFDGNGNFPTTTDIQSLQPFMIDPLYLGSVVATQIFCGEITTEALLPEHFSFVDSRAAILQAAPENSMLICRAIKIRSWHRKNRYCGVCGSSTRDKLNERAKECIQCGSVVFPRISPAVILAIVNDGKILLARSKNRNYAFHSVIAGFVEAGESLETSAQREAFEEVGIRIKNIRYFASQPWPFPDSLMCAFTAEYDGGDIVVDNIEIESAAWYLPSELPAIPASGSVSRKLIDWFVQTYS